MMKIQELAERLNSSKSEQEMLLLLRKYLVGFGIHAYAFTLYAQNVRSGKPLQYHCVSPALRMWHVHYLAQNYADIDRTLEHNQHMGMPLFWDINQQISEAKNVRERRMREESKRFGIDKGLSLPVHGPNGDFASLTLHQLQNEKGLANYRCDQYEWLVAAIVFYQSIKRVLLPGSTGATISLTRREKQCLRFIAENWLVTQIAKELKISVSTVNFHIQNANKKLGVRNKYQAVQKWLQQTS